MAAAFERRDSPLAFPGLEETESSDDSRAINNVRAPHIVIAGAGMCEGGRVQYHLLHHLERPEHLVLLVGYQVPGTLGARLLAGAQHVRILGVDLDVRAEIRQIGDMTYYNDGDWVESCTALAEEFDGSMSIIDWAEDTRRAAAVKAALKPIPQLEEQPA